MWNWTEMKDKTNERTNWNKYEGKKTSKEERKSDEDASLNKSKCTEQPKTDKDTNYLIRRRFANVLTKPNQELERWFRTKGKYYH